MALDPRLSDRKLHMTVVYPDGTVYPGKRDMRPIVTNLGLDELSLVDWSVCDIATDEGFFAFWAEGKNAARTIAIDVDDFAKYDWGYYRDEKCIEENNAFRANGGKRVFDLHHENIRSNVEYFPDSIYDLRPEKHGVFDLIFNFGLLYHLRHPLLSFDVARKVCKGTMIVETQINNSYSSDIPLLQFYRTTEHRSPSAWSGPSTACTTHMMKDAGFDHVFFTKTNYPHKHRQIYVGCVNDEHKSIFMNNPNLTYCDDAYWDRCFEASKVWDGQQWLLHEGEAVAPAAAHRSGQTDSPNGFAKRFRRLFAGR